MSKISDTKRDNNNNSQTSLGISSNKERDENKQKNKDIRIVPFKNVFLKIYKDNHYYILDRYRYDINTIMMLLDLNKINKLHDFYSSYPDGIERELFVKIMEKELPNNLTDPTDQTNLVYGLYKFFCEIDFNGDGQMQWEEFTQFIIDTVEGDNDAKIDEAEDDNKQQIFNEKKMIKYKRYHVSTRIKDNLIHKRDVITAAFIPRIDLIIVSEYSTKSIKIYNPKTGHNEKVLNLETYLNPVNYLERENKYHHRKKNDETKLKKKKPLERQPRSTTYSVLSITHYQNIVAICLSDKRIVFFHFASDDRIELIHEMHLPCLEKRVWFLPEHNIWVSSGCKLEKYNYYTLNELDIEFEYYNQKYECLFNEDHPFRKHYCDFFPHKGEIMDCIEILKPMMILTACMDGKIRLINLSDRDVIKVWNHHSLGVRSLDYNPLIDNVGYVLSVGFEYFINVYCTDLSIDDAFKGKLEGHYAPVISCKFLSNSYMAVSVDEEANVRIWDTKIKSCLQLIVSPKKNFKVTNILCMSKYNKFLVFGNKIIYYDANYKEEEKEQKNQMNNDNYPIKVEFNRYYQQFFVTTFRDIRVYTKDGNIYKTYKKLITNEHFDSDTVIRDFIFENNYRKFYIGFSNGAIMQFNAGNGSLIKSINEHEIERDGAPMYNYSHSKEISSLYYYHDDGNENLLLISTAYDSLINIYNEKKSDETEQLRTIRGGHTIAGKVNEITCLAFSQTMNLFATGSTENLVVVWDFEMSKIDDVFYLSTYREKTSVRYLKFLDPYSILAASYTNGTLYFWGTRQNRDRGRCIFRARNYYKYHGIDITTINAMDIYEGYLPEMRYDVPLRKYFDENSPFMNPHKVYEIPKKKVQKNKTQRRDSFLLLNIEEKDKEEEESQNDEDLNLDIVPEIYKNEIIDPEIDSELYIAKKESKELKESTIADETSPRYYLFLGDNFGNVKALDLVGFLKKNKIDPASKATIKSSFNIMKKDDINVETLINHNLVPQGQNILPKYTNMYHKMIRNEFKAHNDSITCFTIIKEPLCFVTGGKDKFVKIWDLNCNCLGVINALPKLSKLDGELPPWKFKINEEKILEDEINEVVGIFEEVGVEPIEIGSKMDKEAENIEVREKVEICEAPKKEVAQFIKRKFKKLEKKEKRSKKLFSDENKTNLSYEGFYVQNAQKNIENMLEEKVPNIGMNEITKKFIDNMVDNEKGKKRKMNKKNIENEGGNEMLSKQDSIDKNKLKLKMSSVSTLKKIFKLDNTSQKLSNKFIAPTANKNNLNTANNVNTASNVNNNIINTNTNVNVIRDNKRLHNTIFSPVKTKEDLLNNKDLENMDLINLYKSSKSNNISSLSSWKINNLRRKPKPISILENTDDNNSGMGHILSDDNIISKNRGNYMSLKKKKNIGRNYYKLRDTFYTEKLFGKTATTTRTEMCIKKDKINSVNKFKRNLTNLQLPFLNDNIIFQKGETEKLLNLQFYRTSYKACCEIAKQNDMPNSSIQKNYKNNWKLVEQYAKDIRNKKNVLVKKTRNTSLNFYNRPKMILKTTSPTTE